MRALIVYYSRTGVTRKAAEKLAASLDGQGVEAHVEEIIEQKDRSGIFGWLGAGRDASMKRPAKIDAMRNDPSGFDVVLIGTPVWAWTAAPAARAFCEQYEKSCGKVAFFCTMGGSGDKGAFTAMEGLCRRTPLATLALLERNVRKDDAEGFAKVITSFALRVCSSAGE